MTEEENKADLEKLDSLRKLADIFLDAAIDQFDPPSDPRTTMAILPDIMTFMGETGEVDHAREKFKALYEATPAVAEPVMHEAFRAVCEKTLKAADHFAAMFSRVSAPEQFTALVEAGKHTQETCDALMSRGYPFLAKAFAPIPAAP